MQISVLIENTTRDAALVAEHGLSLYIHAGGLKLLFDMGASRKFLQNAESLGIDLGTADMAVVSHAHYDHGGGLGHFLAVNAGAKVYLGRKARGDYYANMGARLPLALHPLIYPWIQSSRLFSRAIGLNKTVLDQDSDRIHVLKGDTRIHDHIFLLTSIDRQYPLAEGNKFLLKREGARMRPDDFAHELIMVVQEPDGLVVFTGCGHNGILNIISTVRKAFADQTIKGVVGGFHLALQPRKSRIAGKRADILLIAEALLDLGVRKVFTGHCTGETAFAILRDRMGNRIERLYTGARISL